MIGIASWLFPTSPFGRLPLNGVSLFDAQFARPSVLPIVTRHATWVFLLESFIWNHCVFILFWRALVSTGTRGVHPYMYCNATAGTGSTSSGCMVTTRNTGTLTRKDNRKISGTLQHVWGPIIHKTDDFHSLRIQGLWNGQLGPFQWRPYTDRSSARFGTSEVWWERVWQVN